MYCVYIDPVAAAGFCLFPYFYTLHVPNGCIYCISVCNVRTYIGIVQKYMYKVRINKKCTFILQLRKCTLYDCTMYVFSMASIHETQYI